MLGGLSAKEFMEAFRRVRTPVLAVPYVGSFAGVEERILVAWNGGPESTRAVNEALPLLCGAKAVMVLLSDLKYLAGLCRERHGGRHPTSSVRATRHSQGGQLFADKEADRATGC